MSVAEPLIAIERPTSARYVTLGFLCALTFILYLDRMCIGQAATSIEQDLQLSKWQMSWVHAAFFIAYGLFEVIAGHWGDRFGSRLVLIRIVAWWSIFTALTGASSGFAMLIATRFLFGAGEAGALPNASRLVDRWFPQEERGKVRSIVQLPALIGATVAPIATAYLIEAFTWRWVFAIYGAVGLVWSVMFAWWFRETPAEHSSVNAAELVLIGKAPPPPEVHGLPWREILASRNVWLLSGVLSAGASCVTLIASWYPTYLVNLHNVSKVESGYWFSLIMLGGALGCFSGGYFADQAAKRIANMRWTFSLVGGTCFALAAICMLAGALCPVVSLKSLGFAGAVFFIQAHASSWWGANSEMSGSHSAAVFGVINSAGALVSAVPQLGFGAVPKEQWDMCFLLMAMLLVGGCVCWFAVDVRKHVFSDAPMA